MGKKEDKQDVTPVKTSGSKKDKVFAELRKNPKLDYPQCYQHILFLAGESNLEGKIPYEKKLILKSIWDKS